MAPTTSRTCPVCGATLTPWTSADGRYVVPMTAHEFACFTARPDLVPDHLRSLFAGATLGERRSAAAKRGV